MSGRIKSQIGSEVDGGQMILGSNPATWSPTSIRQKSLGTNPATWSPYPLGMGLNTNKLGTKILIHILLKHLDRLINKIRSKWKWYIKEKFNWWKINK